jgi:hypothetical protein
MATLVQDNLVYHFMKPALIKVLQGFRAGNNRTELGKCNLASREPNQPLEGVKMAPQFMLRLSQRMLRLLMSYSGRNQAVLKVLTLGSD